jgi:hypothetical protein
MVEMLFQAVIFKLVAVAVQGLLAQMLQEVAAVMVVLVLHHRLLVLL